MKQEEFTYLLEDFVAETLDYQPSEYDKRYFWGHFQRLSENLKCDLSAAWDLEAMIHYDAVEIQKFRHKMANSGIELTIQQVEVWLVMLEIVLISVGFYEWEQV